MRQSGMHVTRQNFQADQRPSMTRMVDVRIDCLGQLRAIDDWRLERLARHLQANLHEPLSLSRAAELCALEMTYFSRYFRMRIGTGFKDWYRGLRIERAKALLANRRAKVDDVRKAVGYKHITTFERAFRKCTGVCPAEFKKSLRSANHSIESRIRNSTRND
jgi:transcriptional regulator GlxA family with amidase domain